MQRVGHDDFFVVVYFVSLFLMVILNFFIKISLLDLLYFLIVIGCFYKSIKKLLKWVS